MSDLEWPERLRLRYKAALEEVIAAQEAYYMTSGGDYPLWWIDSYAESLERGAEGELQMLKEDVE